MLKKESKDKFNNGRLFKRKCLQEYPNTMIYLERKQSDGKVREGLMGMVDLEDYSYEKVLKH